MVNNVDDMTILHKKMESLGPTHQRNRFWPANTDRRADAGIRSIG